MKRLAALSLACALGTVPVQARAATNLVLQTQGRLLDASDQPVTAPVAMTFQLWAAATPDAPGGREAKWTSTLQVDVRGGTYAALLGQPDVPGGAALGADLFAGERWFSVTIDGKELLPRQRIGAVPQAVRAQLADDLACQGCVADEEIAQVSGAKVTDGTLKWSALAPVPAGLSLPGLGQTHDHDARYYQKADFGPQGAAQIDWSRIDNVPSTLGAIYTGGSGITVGADRAIALAPNAIQAGSGISIAADRTISLAANALQAGSGISVAADRTISLAPNALLAGNGISIGADRTIAVKDEFLRLDGTKALTGPLTLASSTPTSDLQAASKGYVDANVKNLALGRSPETAASGCVAIYNAGNKTTGRYWVDFDGLGTGNPPVQVWCEQEYEGGGWLLLHNSVAGPLTRPFWNILYAQRFGERGTPEAGSNYYNGAYYTLGGATYPAGGREFMDRAEGIATTRSVLLFRARASGIDTTTMRLQNPVKIAGSDDSYSCHFAAGWASSDKDFDDAPTTNCATSYNNVTQHYCNCWNTNLGSDADNSGGNTADGDIGPHIANSTLDGVASGTLQDGSSYTRVRRISRYVKF